MISHLCPNLKSFGLFVEKLFYYYIYVFANIIWECIGNFCTHRGVVWTPHLVKVNVIIRNYTLLNFKLLTEWFQRAEQIGGRE